MIKGEVEFLGDDEVENMIDGNKIEHCGFIYWVLSYNCETKKMKCLSSGKTKKEMGL